MVDVASGLRYRPVMRSIEHLKAGFRGFRDKTFPERREAFEKLVEEGQHPRVCVVACADSRIDPCQVLQAEPGELFMIRNVANLVPPCEEDAGHHGTSAALEYAVSHLEVAHIIVLGHSYCGGVGALLDGSAEKSRFIGPWMSLVRTALLRTEATMQHLPMDTRARVCEQSAVLVSLENLMTFPSIRERVGDGRLRLHGWYVDIRECVLRIFDPDKQAFLPVE